MATGPDPGYSSTFWLNIAQTLSITRSEDDTHTRIRGVSVYLPPEIPVIEALVVETPEEIAALVAAARAQTMQVVSVQVKETVEEILALLA